MNVKPAGDRAVLCDVADLDTAHRLRAAIVAADLDDVVDVVPAWRTVLVVTSAPQDLTGLANRIRELPLPPTVSADAGTHVIAVKYDGPDLDEVAAHTGLTVEDVVRRHTEAAYTVAFLGFQPGFPYLAGMDPALATPRKRTPRTSVPAGAVGIADAVTGIYPRSSPGGWQVIGHTDTTLFDVRRDPPALFAPGDRVHLRAAP
jgi:KipI family sensor histidine kinase inhibitor